MLDNNNCLDYNWWIDHRRKLYNDYPKPRNVFRLDIELTNPALFLSDVEVFRNPHGPFSGINGLGEYVSSNGSDLIPQHCMYCCDDWSVVFDPIFYTHPNGNPAVRMIIESCHKDPTYGDRVILFSSFTTCWTEPWGYNKPNLYLFYKNMFWLVSFREFASEWKFSYNYPISIAYAKINTTNTDPRSYQPEDFQEPSFFTEKPDEHYDWFENVVIKVFHNIDAGADFLVYIDYFNDKRWDFASYLFQVLEKFNFKQPIHDQWEIKNLSSISNNRLASFIQAISHYKRSPNKRTAKLFLLIAIQFWTNKYIFSYPLSHPHYITF